MDFFESLISALLDSGDTVDIATCETDRVVPKCYRDWGCKVYPISCSRSPLNRGNLSAIREIRGIAQNGNYDIVHCHTPIAAACTRFACKKLRKNGLKVFYTAHGFHFYKGAPLKNWLLYYPVEWLCAHWTDVLITINREDYERAKKHMHAKRVEYVPGVGIDVKRFADARVDRAAKRREIGVPEDATLLMSVGELNENKNHAVIIRALAKLNDKNVHYAIAGEGPLKEELNGLAESLGVGAQVHLLGYRNDVPELYKITDIFAFPSIREGLPVSVMEAMASGLPIISARNRGTSDLLADCEDVMIERFDDAERFAESISKLCASDAIRQRLGAENSVCSAKYDVETINSQMLGLYKT